MASIIIGDTVVAYKREQRHWTAVNGTLNDSFPAGPDGKQEALLKAIAHENAELYQFVVRGISKNPEWWKSWTKAATAVINDMVHPPRKPGFDQVAWIQSDSRDECDYDLHLYNQFIRCECEGYQFKRAPQSAKGQICCWHVLAALLAMKTEAIPQVALY
ncbi:MAG: SWIM zinc finger family protein [Ardenticatenaceae bacterium]|nr:SWIM zinc finger family protein [Ardenticatenaceae bacterium]